MCRLGRVAAGLRYAHAVEHLMPSHTLYSGMANPASNVPASHNNHGIKARLSCMYVTLRLWACANVLYSPIWSAALGSTTPKPSSMPACRKPRASLPVLGSGVTPSGPPRPWNLSGGDRGRQMVRSLITSECCVTFGSLLLIKKFWSESKQCLT